MPMSKFDDNVILFFLLLGLIGGYYRYTDKVVVRSMPYVASVPAFSEKSIPFRLLAEPRALPEQHVVDRNRAAVTLDRFHGRVVLVGIWATWCIPCREEVRQLGRLQENLGGPEFEVMALSVDQGGLNSVQRFYRKAGIDWLKVYVDSGGYVVRDLNLIGLPTTILIDRSGREVGRAVGPTDWESEEVRATIRRVVKEAR